MLDTLICTLLCETAQIHYVSIIPSSHLKNYVKWRNQLFSRTSYWEGDSYGVISSPFSAYINLMFTVDHQNKTNSLFSCETAWIFFFVMIAKCVTLCNGIAEKRKCHLKCFCFNGHVSKFHSRWEGLHK